MTDRHGSIYSGIFQNAIATTWLGCRANRLEEKRLQKWHT